MAAAQEGSIFGEWMPADVDAFQGFRIRWLASGGLNKSLQQAILASSHARDFRCRLTVSTLAVNVGDVNGRSSGQIYQLDGKTHAALSLASVAAGGAFRYRCEELSFQRLVMASEQPDVAHTVLRCTFSLEADGRTLRLAYEQGDDSAECLLVRASPSAPGGGRPRSAWDLAANGGIQAMSSLPSPGLQVRKAATYPRLAGSRPALQMLPESRQAFSDSEMESRQAFSDSEMVSPVAAVGCTAVAAWGTGGGGSGAGAIRRLLGGCFMSAEEAASLAAAAAAAAEQQAEDSNASTTASFRSRCNGSFDSNGSCRSRSTRAKLRRLQCRLGVASAETHRPL